MPVRRRVGLLRIFAIVAGKDQSIFTKYSLKDVEGRNYGEGALYRIGTEYGAIRKYGLFSRWPIKFHRAEEAIKLIKPSLPFIQDIG